MFHVELRQFPHVARAFNLNREELMARILVPWVARQAFELDGRHWSPDKARLSIYEGRELGPQEIGLGRGWGNVTRTGQEVTVRLLAEVQGPPGSRLERLKEEIVARASAGAVPVGSLTSLAGEQQAASRASERLALVESAVWELLHEGRVSLLEAGRPVERARWQPLLLAWETWAGSGVSIAV